MPDIFDGAGSAKVAGLRYVDDRTAPGIRRVGRRPPFRYLNSSGRPVKDARVLERIRALVIPPAWTGVWICADPQGHLQATGRDARGRKQYRYHPRWRVVRDEAKYGRLIPFARALPRIRRQTAVHLRRPGLPREKVLATVVQLLERTLIRIGNEEYARDNGSIGLTTMRDAHARVNGTSVRFEFRGKSGVQHAVDLRDRRLMKIIKACRDLPGHELFQYIDDVGSRQAIDSSEVNAYLREVSREDFTAKDFRTWAGTVLAARELAAMASCSSATAAKRNVVKAIAVVAARLGNTKAVCRKCYVHPAVLESYLLGRTIRARAAVAMRRGGLDPVEVAVMRLLEACATPTEKKSA
jgi:DNA topoisomerase I